MKNDGAEHVCIDVCGTAGACNDVILSVWERERG